MHWSDLTPSGRRGCRDPGNAFVVLGTRRQGQPRQGQRWWMEPSRGPGSIPAFGIFALPLPGDRKPCVRMAPLPRRAAERELASHLAVLS